MWGNGLLLMQVAALYLWDLYIGFIFMIWIVQHRLPGVWHLKLFCEDSQKQALFLLKEAKKWELFLWGNIMCLFVTCFHVL